VRRYLVFLGNDLEKPSRHAHQRLQLADIDERCAADGGRCGACVGKNAILCPKTLNECFGDLLLIETAATIGHSPVRDADYKH
jgi:hypothetical protein